jgi:DNA-directed RNA polymerase specialized sigma24 family protein
MVSMIYMALRGATDLDREAFILSGIEGFSVEEIAAITERKPQEVRNSIVAARQQLRKSLSPANQLGEKPIHKTGTI